jgi:DNA-binding transcriptional MerR regulator
MDMNKTGWTLAELADETGLSARTIRYYITRGLLDGPGTAGRGATYGLPHLLRLREIQEQQRDGRMLAEIAATTVDAEVLPTPVAWQQYTLADGVIVQLRGDLAPWRLKQIRKAMAEMAALLKLED